MARQIPDQPGDYTVYPSIDGIRVSAAWRLGSYGDDGALSTNAVSDLAEQFDLPLAIVENLSKELGHCLDNESEVNLVAVNRATAIKRAEVSLEEAARLAKRIETDAKNTAKLMEGLSDQFKAHDEDAQLLRSANAQINAVVQASVGLEDTVAQIIKAPGAAADMSPLNKTHVRDKRRQYVVETCCYAWQDAGRPVTLTTAHHAEAGKKRKGRLFDFIQEAVARVTDPPTQLSGETLRKDLDRFKKSLLAADPVLMPPIKG